MQLRTPITLVTGPLGSGKTTLLRHILATRPAKLAVVVNEFGEIANDTNVIEGQHVRIDELGRGCLSSSSHRAVDPARAATMPKRDFANLARAQRSCAPSVTGSTPS